MTANEFLTIGLALYGDRWHSPMANAIGITTRTVRRFAAGTKEIPDGVARDVTALVHARGQRLRRVEEGLR